MSKESNYKSLNYAVAYLKDNLLILNTKKGKKPILWLVGTQAATRAQSLQSCLEGQQWGVHCVHESTPGWHEEAILPVKGWMAGGSAGPELLSPCPTLSSQHRPHGQAWHVTRTSLHTDDRSLRALTYHHGPRIVSHSASLHSFRDGEGGWGAGSTPDLVP